MNFKEIWENGDTMKTGYTANILTAKTTGFTCVPFSPVLPLSFWQVTKAGSEPLYFNCTQKFHCLFGYISEPKLQLFPAKITTITYQKYNFQISYFCHYWLHFYWDEKHSKKNFFFKNFPQFAIFVTTHFYTN